MSFDQVIAQFFAQGLPGVAVVVLGWVVWKLYTELRAADKEKAQMIFDFQQALQAVQELRVTDANKTTDRVLELARAIDKNTEVMREALETIHRLEK